MPQLVTTNQSSQEVLSQTLVIGNAQLVRLWSDQMEEESRKRVNLILLMNILVQKMIINRVGKIYMRWFSL